MPERTFEQLKELYTNISYITFAHIERYLTKQIQDNMSSYIYNGNRDHLENVIKYTKWLINEVNLFNK